jgi:hypothetical protein
LLSRGDSSIRVRSAHGRGGVGKGPRHDYADPLTRVHVSPYQVATGRIFADGGQIAKLHDRAVVRPTCEMVIVGRFHGRLLAQEILGTVCLLQSCQGGSRTATNRSSTHLAVENASAPVWNDGMRVLQLPRTLAAVNTSRESEAPRIRSFSHLLDALSATS